MAITQSSPQDKPSHWRCHTVIDVADFYSVSTKTVYRDPIGFGGRRVRGQWRFSMDSILAAEARQPRRRQTRKGKKLRRAKKTEEGDKL